MTHQTLDADLPYIKPRAPKNWRNGRFASIASFPIDLGEHGTLIVTSHDAAKHGYAGAGEKLAAMVARGVISNPRRISSSSRHYHPKLKIELTEKQIECLRSPEHFLLFGPRGDTLPLWIKGRA